jgi:hypothetical protein
MGVNAVSWAPATSAGSLISTNPGPGGQRRFVTGGSDNAVKIWEYKYDLSCLQGFQGASLLDADFNFLPAPKPRHTIL